MNHLARTLLADGPYGRADAPYRLLSVRGPDAGGFLQRLCSQDVLGLAEGQVAPALLLDAKGKVQVTCLVFRLEGVIWLETHAEQVERLAALLERYHFTEQLVIEGAPAQPVAETIAGCDGDGERLASSHGRLLTVSHARRGVQFVRVHGGDDAALAAVVPLTTQLAECLRMVAGMVRVGLETEANTLALEAGLDDHCSTSKGCYTGQEIVARIHTYGHVNRRLCLLQLGDGPVIEAPVGLHEPEDDLPVGRVMHAVPVPGRGMRVGLGYLPKDFQTAGTRLTLAGAGEVVVVEPL